MARRKSSGNKSSGNKSSGNTSSGNTSSGPSRRTSTAATPKSESPARTQSLSKALANSLGKIVALVLVLGLVLLVNHYCSIQPAPFGPDAHIVSIDGDTLRAGNGAAYRLYGIDAPELKQTCEEANGKSWLCGRAAKAKLTTLMKGGKVTCEEKTKDAHGRVIAVCSAEGVLDLGEAMVLAGYAIDLASEGNPYKDAEKEARDAKRGIWRGTFEQPAQWRQDHPRSD
jgi:endonuclease YncB( thermonuclease family)